MSRENVHFNPITIVVIVVSIMLIGGLVRNAVSLYQARSRLEVAKQQMAELQKKKRDTENQMKVQTDAAALDQAIRNNLNLVKPGETIVVISGTESSSLATPTPKQIRPTSPIQHWWNLLNPQ